MKILKREGGGNLGQGVGVLKREGWNPPTNCVTFSMKRCDEL